MLSHHQRHPGIGMFFDSSKSKLGQQALPNRLLFMHAIKYPWNSAPMSNDVIRIEMKQNFFTFHQNSIIIIDPSIDPQPI